MVVARFNADVTDRLLDGARKALADHGVREADVQVLRVPGAWELSPVCARLAKSGILVLSGILVEEADAVREAYAHLEELERPREGDWCAIVLRAPEQGMDPSP